MARQKEEADTGGRKPESRKANEEVRKSGIKLSCRKTLLNFSNSIAEYASLFLDCAAYFSQVFAKCITRIGRSLLQILGKLQLFSQRVPAPNGLRLTPFALPDFLCHAKQLVDTLGFDKQTAVVVGEDDIAGFDQKVTETGGTQRRCVTRIEPSRAARRHAITENGQTNLSELRRIAMRAPDGNSS